LKTSGIYASGSNTINSVVVIIIIIVIILLFIYISKKYKEKPRKNKDKKKTTNYIKNIPNSIKKSSDKITKSLKKEKPVEPQKEEIIQTPQIPIPEEEKIPPVETKVYVDKYMKEQAIQRALNQQEKQRKKLKR